MQARSLHISRHIEIESSISQFNNIDDSGYLERAPSNFGSETITIKVFLANGLAATSYYYGLGNVVDGATYFFFFFLDFFL
jgi:hypothetical protein